MHPTPVPVANAATSGQGPVGFQFAREKIESSLIGKRLAWTPEGCIAVQAPNTQCVGSIVDSSLIEYLFKLAMLSACTTAAVIRRCSSWCMPIGGPRGKSNDQ